MIRRIMKRQIMHQCPRVCRGVCGAFSNIMKIWGKEHGDDNKLQTSAMGQGGSDQDAGLQRRVSDDRRNAQGRSGRDCRKGGPCRISSGSYAGNGKTGQSNPSSLTFDFTPVLVVIIRKSSPGTHTLFVRPNGYGPMGDTMGTITWGEKKVSWYCQNSQVAGDVQMNMSGSDYYYVGLGY